VKVFAVACAFLVLLGGSARLADADEAILTVTGAGYYSVPIKSLKTSKLSDVQIQQYDFSCGSAALATLLTYHYRKPLAEKEIFIAMFNQGRDQLKIMREGFSMLDMKDYLQQIGMSADGYRVNLDKLADLHLPVITVVETKGYKHFVIIKGIKDDRVLISDPAAGNRVEKRSDFEAHWDQAVLIVKSDADFAQTTFNLDRDWVIQPKAPVAITFHQQGLVAGSAASPF